MHIDFATILLFASIALIFAVAVLAAYKVRSRREEVDKHTLDWIA
jgi:hypothetical protein